jgi:hypothetical protein
MKANLAIALMATLFMSSLFADSAVISGSNSQIYSFHIIMNKTASNIGIDTFSISNQNNVTIASSYQNCTITSSISCSAIFVIQGGIWNSINVYDNGNLYESIPIANNITYVQPASQQKTYIWVGVSYLPYIIFGALVIMIAGNIIYYELKKGDI